MGDGKIIPGIIEIITEIIIIITEMIFAIPVIVRGSSVKAKGSPRGGFALPQFLQSQPPYVRQVS